LTFRICSCKETDPYEIILDSNDEGIIYLGKNPELKFFLNGSFGSTEDFKLETGNSKTAKSFRTNHLSLLANNRVKLKIFEISR
jgi:hypothetical protein